MNFGEALEKLKKGEAVTRVGWHGKEMFIAIKEPDETSDMNNSYLYISIPCKEKGRYVETVASKSS